MCSTVAWNTIRYKPRVSAWRRIVGPRGYPRGAGRWVERVTRSSQDECDGAKRTVFALSKLEDISREVGLRFAMSHSIVQDAGLYFYTQVDEWQGAVLSRLHDNLGVVNVITMTP